MIKAETLRVPRNPLFGVLDAFTAKVIYRCKDGETVAVASVEKRDMRIRYKTGRRDVYLLTLPVLPEGRTGGEDGEEGE